MAENQFTNTIDTLFENLNTALSAKTVVGEPLNVAEDTYIIPLVDVSFGMGAGYGKGEKKGSTMGGIGAKMSPSAVLVVKNGQTRLVNVKNQDLAVKIIDMIPDLIDRFTTPKEPMPDNGDVVDVAFPDRDKEE